MIVNISQRESAGVTVIYIGGQLGSNTSGEAMDYIVDCVKNGKNKIVLNVKELEFISSAGLRSILVPAKLLKSSNGQLLVCEASESVRNVLETSGFTTLVSLHKDEREALSALS